MSEENEDETIEVENIVAVGKRKGGRLRVRRAMRIKIPMSISNAGGKKRENYDQDLNKHEWTKEEHEES